MILRIIIFLVPLLNHSVVEENESYALGSVLTFITVFIFIALYESARDIEDPFIFEPNQLPLVTISVRCCKSFEALRKNSLVCMGHTSGGDECEIMGD